MGYQPLLIANFQTGLQKNVQPWLVEDDAQTEIYDAYVRDGVIMKRDGYNYYATGLKSGTPYCESRIVRSASIDLTGTVDGANTTFTASLTTPVRRGGITVTDSSVGQTLTDNGTGSLTGDGIGTIDYTTGSLSITFTSAPTSGTPSATYQYHPGLPVMMVANFVSNDNSQELLVADEDFLNRYNSSTNRLDDITSRVYTGAYTNFFDWVQYPKITDDARLLFVNNVDPIQSYDGTTVTDFVAYMSTDTAVTGEVVGAGTGSQTEYTYTTSQNPVQPGSVTIDATVGAAPVSMTDDGDGNLSGTAGTGTINYYTGAISLTFSTAPDNATNVTIDYTPVDDYVQTCLHMFNYKDRLILLRTTETNGTVYPQRIRISGTGQSGDDFRTSATGAGLIDIPDQEWITGAAFNRDDLIIFTRRSTWILKYTGNDIVPFSLDRLDDTRGNFAPFAPISYLGFTKGYSPKGMVVTDGYQLQRNDDKIPDYTFNEIDQSEFDLCFSGSVDEDDMHYLIHPHPDESPDAETSISDRILVQNYRENNFSVYRIPLSCMGLYYESFGVTWNDLTTSYPDADGVWDAFGLDYANWYSFSYAEDMPISIGGGHKGEIWRLNVAEGEDNPVRVRGLTISSSSPLVLNVVTDWNNYKVGDYVFFSGVDGATEVNGRQAVVESVTGNNTFTAKFEVSNPETINTYTANTGTVSRSIPFEFTTKNFNPYVSSDAKVRCGYLYLRADATDTFLEDSEDNPVPAFLTVDVYSNDNDLNATQIRSTNLEYEGKVSNRGERTSAKRWNKIFINQTGEFLKFRIRNTQAGSTIRLHAMNLGIRPVGRIL